MCLWIRYNAECNEHYHRTAYEQFAYDVGVCDPVSPDYIKENYLNKYDERGRRYEYILTQEILHYGQDSLHYGPFVYSIDSFTYVGCPVGIDEFSLAQSPLSIVPNPGDEAVRITAADSIATITLYTSDGRLAYTQEGSGKEIILNLQGLAKGVYLVRALLKNGKIQTGKMVMR